MTVTFDRRLAGDKVGQHKVPPISTITMTISATVSTALPNVTLIDHFPSAWGVIDTGGGVLGPGDPVRTISWDLGPVAAGGAVSATYQLFSPSLESPPAKYDFTSELAWPGASVQDSPWQVIVADPTATTQYLHAADVAMGSRTFNTVNTNNVAGTLAELSTGNGGSGAITTLADAAGISIFASDPVPAGQQWDLGGTWSVNIYMKVSAARTLTDRLFSIYRIDAYGNATRIYRGQNTTNTSIGTSYQLFTWSPAVPAGTTVGPGERFGVEFAVGLDDPATVYLGFDSSSQNSRVTAQITSQSAPAVVKEAHFRIGKDTALTSMQWYGATDDQTPGVLRGTNFRVRFQLYNNGASNKSWTSRLEWASSAAGTWSAVPTTSGAAPFFVADTTQYANGAAIPTASFGLGAGIGTAQNGVAYDAQNPGGGLTLNANSYTEVEFNLQANSNAAYYTVYLFRLTDNGTALSSYNNDAQISVWEPQNPSGPHVIGSATPDNCAACHRTHVGQGPELRKIYNDKQACMTCHDGTGTQLSLSTEFDTYSYRHPIEATTGVHRAGEGYSANWNLGASRHVACMDCHNPHLARTGASTPGFGDTPNNVAGTWGVSPNNPTTNWADVPGSSFTRVNPVAEEYQLCLKCHSSYAYGASPPPSHSGGITETNQARESNVNNQSYHYVEHDKTAASGYTPRTADPGRMMTFATGSGLTPSTKINCTDCHSSANQSDPRGAHGSQNPYLLRGTWSTNQYGNCLRCHDVKTYGPQMQGGDPNTSGKTGFSGEKPNLHVYHMSKGGGVPGCQACHSAVPHGGQYKALLVPRKIGATTLPTDDYNANSKLIINTWATSGGWSQSDCGIYPGGGH